MGLFDPFDPMPTKIMRTSCLGGFYVILVPKLLLTHKNLDFWPKNGQNWLFWPNIGIIGPFGPVAKQKTMRTGCLGGFSVTWVPKLLLPLERIRILSPKRTNLYQNWHFLSFEAKYWHFWPNLSHVLPKYNANKVLKRHNFAQKLHFCSFWAKPCRLIWCPVGGLGDGCGARAVYRNPPIYFIELMWKMGARESSVALLPILYAGRKRSPSQATLNQKRVWARELPI